MNTQRYMKRRINLLVFVILLGAIFVQCKPKTEYQRIVEREMASGIRQDSLFLGIYFGMTSEDFYKRCWELNKEGLIMEGGNNATVQYKLDELEHKGALEFYPIFKDEKLQSMTGYAHYFAWAPWNTDMFADKLIDDFKDFLETWFGAGFISVPSPGVGKAYAHVAGNRRIVLYYTKDERVEILITDLTNDDGILTKKAS